MSHHGYSPLFKPTGIQIATKSMPGPTNQEHRKLFGVKTMSLGTNYSFYCCIWSAARISESELLIQATGKTVWCAASISESELQATEKTVWCAASISESELQAIEKTVWCAASISESELQAIEKIVWCAASISESELQAIEKTVWCAASISESELQATWYREDCLVCCQYFRI